MSMVSPQNGTQHPSIVTNVHSLLLQDVHLKNSTAATKLLNFMAHVPYQFLRLGKITVASGGSKKEKKIARTRIISELIKPSVLGLNLASGWRIEYMDVIDSCETFLHMEADASRLPTKFSPDAVLRKLKNSWRETTRSWLVSVPTHHDFRVDEFVKLLCKFDNCPAIRYEQVRGFASVSRQGFRAAWTETSSTTAIGTCRAKVVTHGIPFHLHKFLGLLCLCSFALRLSDIGNNDTAFWSHPKLTVATVLLHFLLNVTSFVLALSHQRSMGGTGFWSVSRIHTLCFVSLSLATILWTGYETHVLVPPELYVWLIAVIVSGNFVVLDYGSSTINHPSSTIRIRDAWGPAVLHFRASMMQFFVHCLMGFRERVSIQFNVVCIMQMTAFLITMHRKNLTRRPTVVLLYMLQSVLSIPLGRFLVDQTKNPALYEQFMTHWNTFFLVGNTAAMLLLIPIAKTTTPQTPTSPWRLIWLLRKYVVWILLSLWCIELRNTVYGTANWWTRAHLEQAFMASVLALLAIAYYQVTLLYVNEGTLFIIVIIMIAWHDGCRIEAMNVIKKCVQPSRRSN